MNPDISWWLIPLWMMLFVLDDYLTVLIAKRYDKQDPHLIEFEGGYELTPQYKDEIAHHRLFGPAFLRSLIIYTIALSLVWYIVSLEWLPAAFFQFFIGATILMSASVNVRHAQNLVFFGLIPVPEHPSGKISYPSSFSYRGSAVGFLAFGTLYLGLAILMRSWFFSGGAFACGVVGMSHWIYSNRAVNADPAAG